MARSTNLISAPNLKKQPIGATECKIFVGSQAWDFAQIPEMERSQSEIALDETLPVQAGYPPIVLSNKELANLTAYQLAPSTARYVEIHRANKAEPLSESMITILCNLLTQQTAVETLVMFDESGLQLENLSSYIKRLREDTSTQEIAKLTVEASKTEEQRLAEFTERFKHLSPYEQLLKFTAWLGKPMRYNQKLKMAYQYTGKKWEMIEPDNFGSLILKYMTEHGFTKFSANKIDQIMDMSKYAYPPLERCNPDLLGFSNGVLNKRTGEFIPHKEEHFLTSFINIDYFSEQTPTPNFDKWLNWVSEGKERKRLHILAGGEENTTSMSLKDLEDPVMRCDLIEKTLCYSPDQESYINDGGVLRSITGGDMILFNPKYIRPFKDEVRAVFLITGNSPIIFKEQKGGTSRRRVIFQFNRVVSESEKDYQLKEKLEQEAGGIVRLLLDTFPEPMEAKALLEVQKTSDEALEVKEEHDHILQFAKHFEARGIINGLTLGSSRKPNAHRVALHSAYLYYCERMGIVNPLQRNRFRQAFEYALKERGSPNSLKTRIKDGLTVTNIYYVNMVDSLKNWND